MDNQTTWITQIREKFIAIRDKRDEAENRELEAKEKIKEALGKKEKLEEDVQAFRNRLKLTQKEMETVVSKHKDIEMRLEQTMIKSDGDNDKVKVLEDFDIDRDQDLGKLDVHYIEVKKEEHEKITELEECQRRYEVTKNELAKAQDKVDFMEARAAQMEDDLVRYEEKLQHLEERDSQQFEKFQLAEEKIHFLLSEIDTVSLRLDEAERMVAKRMRESDETCEEIGEYKKKLQNVHNEMESIRIGVEEID